MNKETIDIATVRHLKDVLETLITDLLRNFQEDTGLNIDAVQISIVSSPSGRTVIESTEVEISL